MKNAATKETFIREVTVTYRTTEIDRRSLKEPGEVARLVRQLLPDNSREHFITLYLDGALQVASYAVVSTGTANATQVHAREVFQRAVLVGAVAIIVAHNHPSENATPSDSDVSMTRRLKEAGQILGIEVLDHLIVTDSDYVSLQEQGRFN